MKVKMTIDALNKRGIEARIPDLVSERLSSYDLIHVFAPYNGNDRIVQQAKSFGLPVVISTILNTSKLYSDWDVIKIKILTRVVGKLTNWDVTTSYQSIRRALEEADHLIALGKNELNELNKYYEQPLDKISIVYNGISNLFFEAKPELFESLYKIPHPFVLHTGILGDVKNQLGLVRALKNKDINIVLIGCSDVSSNEYLNQCLSEGQGKVHYLGEFKPGDARLVSAYAAADIVAIPSKHEGMPNSILEALAAGTPTVLTKNNTLDMKFPSNIAIEVDPENSSEIHAAIIKLLNYHSGSEKCRNLVRPLTWDAAAQKLESIYLSLVTRP